MPQQRRQPGAQRPRLAVRHLNPNDPSRALLWEADLTSANLSGANLTEAVLADADLTGRPW
ncbi:pentapeptide repeat-containing protein [Streptomyces sp. NBC_01077]|uniref:pentapeptide repeat-containing protein n=1 Tax=Streptomyces sp. NBC_01077 TaxID=2903746 RepID=UPI00386942E8